MQTHSGVARHPSVGINVDSGLIWHFLSPLISLRWHLMCQTVLKQAQTEWKCLWPGVLAVWQRASFWLPLFLPFCIMFSTMCLCSHLPPLFSPLFRAVCPQVSKAQSPRRRRQRSVQRTPGLSSKEGRNQQLYTIMFGVKPNLLYIAWKLLTKLKKSNRLSCKNTRLRQMILVRYKSIVNQINYNNLHVNFLFIWQDISFLTGETLKLDVMQTSSDS